MIIDFITTFSNWILIWFLLYYFNIISYNPLFVLILVYTLILIFIFYIYDKINRYKLIKFIILNIICKLIPIYLLIRINKYYIKYDDIIFSIILFLIYFIVLYIFNKNIVNIYNEKKAALISCNIESNNIYCINDKTLIGNIYDNIYYNLFNNFNNSFL